MKVKIPCHCGNSFDYEYDEDVTITKDITESIVHGKFMNTVCDKCGLTLKPEFPVTFTYPSKNLTIILIPDLQRDLFLRGKHPLSEKKPNRFVIGFRELAEKINIFEAGLDDITVECVKYYILSRIETESEPENEILVFFDRVENGKLLFQIHGLKEKEIGILKIDRDYYNMTAEKLEQSKSEEPFCRFLAPPYVSLLKIYREYTDNMKD